VTHALTLDCRGN